MPNGYSLYDDGVLRIITTNDPPGLAIAGEIDESTYAGLVNVLEQFTDGLAEVHVSLGAVSYCDLAGLRAIVCVAGGSGDAACGNGDHSGRQVVLHQVPPQLITVLQIVGWDCTPGLALDRPGGNQQHGSRPAGAGTREPAGTSEHDTRGSPV